MPVDYLLDDDWDLQIAGGDFVKGPCNEQDITAMLISGKGNWKQWPLLGIGIQSRLEGAYTAADLARLKRDISLELEVDGFKVNDVAIQLGNGEILTINPDADRE